MLKNLADALVYQVMNIQAGTMLGEALDFFFYDTMKVFFSPGRHYIRGSNHPEFLPS